MVQPTILPEQQQSKTGAPTDALIDYAGLKPRIPVCDRTLRGWIRTGKIPSVRLSGSRRRLFFWPDVLKAILRHTEGGSL